MILLVEVGCDEIELRAGPPDLREAGGDCGVGCDGEGQEDAPEINCKRGAAQSGWQEVG